ncbi:hypothetical protein PLESTF_001785900 [Pleodorina starrii]|nr:hypothetical protein PLESTF_001785900 [Pleodorina starrii]
MVMYDPNVLYLTVGDYDYRMYDKSATQRMSHSRAATFCHGLGKGWNLVPYWDEKAYDAVRKLCADHSFTCWLDRKDTDAYCPLMAADGSRQMQGCEQDVRFVCRKKRF